MKKYSMGKSVQGKDIIGYEFGDKDAFNKTLIIGCLHGVEPQSKDICEMYIKDIKSKEFVSEAYTIIIPCLNPDGLELKIRQNANKVDINRNFPSSTWSAVPAASKDTSNNSPYFPGQNAVSEPETKVIVDLMNRFNFKKVVAIHTNHYVENPNPPMINFDGEQSRELAEKLGIASKLPVHQDIGYPTPGSLGIWIGIDLKKKSITVELDDEKKADELYKTHHAFFDVAVSDS